MREPRTVTGDVGEPYPDEPGPARVEASEALYECHACGSTFTLRESADGAELLDVKAFLALHRRCVRQLLTYGGAFAKQTPRRRTR